MMSIEREPILGKVLINGFKVGGMALGVALAFKGFPDIIPEAASPSGEEMIPAGKAIGGVVLFGLAYLPRWRV